jgi:mercuric ion binding protein
LYFTESIYQFQKLKMKIIKFLAAGFMGMAIATVSMAQSKTESFAVSGNCGMCKSNIEKAAKKAGAQTANWNKETKKLTVTYSSSTTNTAKIQQRIADAGYDNAGFKAPDNAYQKLETCCQYDRDTKETAMSCCSGDKMDCKKDGKDCCDKSKKTSTAINSKE